MTSNPGPHSPIEERWQPSVHAVSQRIGNDIVLVHLRTGEIYELNATGARIWELLSKGYGRRGIEQQLVQEYEVDEVEVRDELHSLLDTLLAAELVETKIND